MHPTNFLRHALILTPLALLLFIAPWLCLYFSAPQPDPALLLGYLLFLFLASTTLVIITSSLELPPRPLASTFLFYALITDSTLLALLLVSLQSPFLPIASVPKLFLLLASSLAAFSALTTLLRRLLPSPSKILKNENPPPPTPQPTPSGLSKIVSGKPREGGVNVYQRGGYVAFWSREHALIPSLTLAILLLSALVVFTPLLRLFDPPWQARLVTTLTYACPPLALFDAVPLPLVWQQQALMYQLTPLGQNLPVPTPAWQTATLIYLALALLFLLLIKIIPAKTPEAA